MPVGRTRTRDRHLPRGVYLHHGAYWYRWYEGGKKRSKRLAVKYPEALAQLSLLLKSVTERLTVEALVARYELEQLPKKAETSRRNERYRLPTLVKCFGKMRPDDIEPHDVWDYWRERGEGSAARHEIAVLSAVLTFGRRIGAMTKPNPCYGLKLPGGPPRDRYVTDEEFLMCRSHATVPMVAHAMNLALAGGMDRSTILSLERRHLTEEGIRFVRSKTVRRERVQEVQLIRWTDDLREIVQAIKREPPEMRRPLICTRQGKRFTADGFKTHWHRTMDAYVKAGGERFHFHDLRAKSASDADSDQAAADRLGHQDPALTRRVYRRLPRIADPLKLPTPRKDA